jgi:hypothetical protein
VDRFPAEDPPGHEGGHRVVQNDHHREEAEVRLLLVSGDACGRYAQVAAYARWAAPENRQPFTEIAHAALRDLQARAAALGAGAGVKT